MTWKRQAIDTIVWAASAFRKVGPSPQQKPPREILVMRSCDLGDLLTATPVFEALRRRFPDTKLIGGIGSWAHPILENNPYVDEIAELDVPWNNKVVQESIPAVYKFIMHSAQVEALRARGGIDCALDLLGAHFNSALMLRLGVRYMVGIRDYRAGWRACDAYTEYSPTKSVARASLDAAALIGATDLPEARPQIYLTDAERAEAVRIWGPPAVKEIRLLVGAGGGMPEKCWPPESVAAALREITDVLRPAGVTLNILLSGGKADQERAAVIMAQGPSGIRSTCGDTALRVSFAVAEQASIVLTNSSMLLHASAAFRRPIVTVLGPIHADTDDHDLLWGYPEPYVSAGPSPEGGWPAVEEVVEKLLARMPSF